MGELTSVYGCLRRDIAGLTPTRGNWLFGPGGDMEETRQHTYALLRFRCTRLLIKA
jgi:hypothetical protein